MLSTYLASTVDSVLTTTLANYRETLIDNIFDDFVYLWWMREKGKVRKEDGGTSIVEHLLYEKSTAGGWYTGYDPLDLTPQEGMRPAEFLWRQCAYSITISRLEERMNSGKSRMINLLQAKTYQAENTIKDAIASALFAATRASKAIETLVDLVDSSTTVGGLSRTTYSWWQSTETASGSFASQGISDMRTLYNTISSSAGKDHPDLIITTRAIYEYYEAALLPQVRYQSLDMADAGFESLRFKGSDIVYDQYATSGVIYMLNSKYINLVIDKETDFVTTPFIKPSNQDGKSAQILFMGNVTVNNPRRLGKLTGVSA
jgi:hypothetical protein